MPINALTASLPHNGSNNLDTVLVLILDTTGLAIKKSLIGIATGTVLFLGTDFFIAAI